MFALARAAVAAALLFAPFGSGVGAQEPTKNEPLTAEQFTSSLLERLSTHKYFSKIGFVEERSFAPLLLLVQKPSLDTPDFAKKLAAAHGPWLRKIDEVFDAHYVQPLKLARRPDSPIQAVAILQTAGDYSNYERASIDLARCCSHWAYYERRAHLTVAYHDGPALGTVPWNYPELVEYVRALLLAHFSGSQGEIPQSWITEGLGGYLALYSGTKPEALDKRTLSTRAVDFLVATSQNQQKRELYLFPIAKIVDLGLSDAWGRALGERADAAGLGDDALGDFWTAYRSQCVLWMHFLHEGDSGKYAPRLMSYLGGALRGSGGLDALRKAFEGVDLAALDREFYAWLYQLYAKANPNKPLDAKVLDQLFKPAPPAVAKAPAPTSAAASEKSAPKPEPAFDPRSVAIASDDLNAEHGRVLQRIRTGDLDGALKQLEELEARGHGSAIEQRLTHELERLRLFAALRERYFAALIASGEKHSFEQDGKKVLAKLVKVENGELVLGENRAKVERLPIASVALVDIARDLPKTLADSPDSWIRNYAYVLEGDERWKRGLAGDSKPVVELRNDAQDWYPATLRFGLVAAALAQLADAGAPSDATTGRVCIERIQAVLARSGQLPVVEARRAALTQLARIALGAQYSPQLLAGVCPVAIEVLGEGRVRVALDFQDPGQLALLQNDPAALREYRRAMDPLGDATENRYGVVDGVLEMRGDVCLRSLLEFEAPIYVKARMRFQQTTAVTAPFVMLCACFQAPESFVGSLLGGGVYVYDVATRESAMGWNVPPIFADHDYLNELKVADQRASAWFEGNEQNAVACKSRTSGAVLVLVHSSTTIRADDLVIEGKLRDASARALFVDSKLAALGLAAK